MPEKAAPQGTFDSAWFWKQWQGATSQIWANALERNTAASPDPSDLYRIWFKSITDAPAQAQTFAQMVNPKEAWKLWFEYNSETWKKVAEPGANPLELTSQWLEMLEEAQTRLLAGETTPTNAFALFKQWYDATNESWSKEVGNLFASDQFMEAVSQFLESYAGFTKMTRRASEEYFRSLQLPTRSDIARLAELVIALEEKVDRLDDDFTDVIEAATQGPGDAALSAFQEHLAQVQKTTTFLPLALEKLQAIDGVARRLDQLERALELLPLALEKIQAVDGLSQRLDQLERKLDEVVSAIERAGRKAQKTPDTLAEAAPRQSARKTASPPPTASAAGKKRRGAYLIRLSNLG
jgi:polyhydroxyalkanoic acid synthase PhaR subunit